MLVTDRIEVTRLYIYGVSPWPGLVTCLGLNAYTWLPGRLSSWTGVAMLRTLFPPEAVRYGLGVESMVGTVQYRDPLECGFVRMTVTLL